jgi:hypothetical protein
VDKVGFKFSLARFVIFAHSLKVGENGADRPLLDLIANESILKE